MVSGILPALTQSAFTIAGQRAVARCDVLGTAPFSDMSGGLYRAYLSPSYAAAQGALRGWMEDAGMEVRRDPAGNLVGRYEGLSSGAPSLLIGSHLDSVRDGGRYDGPLGIMLGVEAVAMLKAAGSRLPFAIEVIAFGDEEGSRFPAAMLTSRAVAGVLSEDALRITDHDGISLADAGVDIAHFLSAARPSGSTVAYLEAHIEQGPVLEAEGLPVGNVTGIAAQLRFNLTVKGVSGHAGTTVMNLRRDALTCAAEMVLAVEDAAVRAASDVVATVGCLETLPGAPNVIAGEVRFTLDIRSGDDLRRDEAADQILGRLVAIARARNLQLTVDKVHDLPASPCDPMLIDLMDAAIRDCGQGVRRLVSGAGHDAMIMAAHCPTAMLFIRCRAGISHNPDEHVEAADAAIALQAMLHFIHRLGAQFAA